MMGMNNIITLVSNGFIQNAGLLGMIRLLEHQQARLGVDYDLKEDMLVIDKTYLATLDLAQAYIDFINQHFYQQSAFPKLFGLIEQIHRQMEQVSSDLTQEEQARLKELYGELLTKDPTLESASFKSGYVILQAKGDYPIPQLLKTLKGTKDWQEKYQVLCELEQLLRHPVVQETLCLKSIAYRVLNKFWNNKAFLTKKTTIDMKQQLVEDVTQFIPSLIQKDLSTVKGGKCCAECGHSSLRTKATTLSILNDMADDTKKKPSAFWNFDKNQALLCDMCTFIYLLSPAGFTTIGHDYVFINANSSLKTLVQANQNLTFEPEEEFISMRSFYNNLIQQFIKKELAQLDNIQVITRMNGERYQLHILNRFLLTQLYQSQSLLEGLAKTKSLKLSSGNYLNSYQAVIENILNYRQHYQLMHQLLRLGFCSDYELTVNRALPLIFKIQQKRRQLEFEHDGVQPLGWTGGEDNMSKKELYFATKHAAENGKALYHHLTYVSSKGINGVMYRLLNAMQTNNKYDFLNTVIRLHSSYGVQLSADFIKGINDDKLFKDMGYAYLLGLKGISLSKESSDDIKPTLKGEE